jgi:hypothetical protein
MTNESWKGGDKRKQSRCGSAQPNKRQNETAGRAPPNSGHGAGERGNNSKKAGKDYEKSNKNNNARPKWKYPKARTEPMPILVCPYCKELIKDLTSAISNKEGEAAHFECVQKYIASRETIEKGDSISYIGGGRFGIVAFDNPHNPRDFKIKKIIEWEEKDNPATWRKRLADRFSLT